jgi:hypothetical protein
VCLPYCAALRSPSSARLYLMQYAVHSGAKRAPLHTRTQYIYVAPRARYCNCSVGAVLCGVPERICIISSTMLRQSEGPRRGKGKNLNLGAIDEMQAVATGAIAARPAMPARKSKLRARVSRPEVCAMCMRCFIIKTCEKKFSWETSTIYCSQITLLLY